MTHLSSEIECKHKLESKECKHVHIINVWNTYAHMYVYTCEIKFVLKIIYNAQYFKFANNALELVCFVINQRMYIMHDAKKYRRKF